MEEATLAKVLALSKQETTKRAMIPVPRHAFPLMKALKGHFELRLGVQINLGSVSDEDILTVRHWAGDTDALSIATTQLEYYACNYSELETLQQELLQQNFHVCVDSSSIIYETKVKETHIHPIEPLRINSSSLGGLLINCRTCIEQVVFGSMTGAVETVDSFYWKRWQVGGFQVKLTNHPGDDSPVDNISHVPDAMDKEIRKNVSNCRSPPHPQRTLVMVTGSGTFINSCSLALQNGWKVELWCWKGCLDPAYQSVDLQGFILSGLFRVHHLDAYRDLLFYRTTV